MPIHYASQNGCSDIVKLLVDAGGIIDAPFKIFNNLNGIFLNFLNLTPIDLASIYGHSSIVSLLIESGAKFNPKKKGTNSPIFYAIQYDHKDVVDVLLDNEIDINHSNGIDTPLTAAIKNGNIEMIDSILNREPNLKATDINGRDPIYLAVEQGNVELFNQFAKSDEINIHRTYNESEQNLLHIACQVVCYDIVMSLLNEFEFLPDQPDKNGDTPLFYAVRYQKVEEEEFDEEESAEESNKDKIVKELIIRGCDPSQINKAGRCPFTIADQQTMETIGKAMEDPQYSIELENRRKYWNNLKEEEIRERYETKKLATKSLNDYDNSRARQLSKLSAKERSKREEQLSIMTAHGGTLRGYTSKNSKTVAKNTEIRPWGGSTETDKFQREIRTKLREMNKCLRDRLNQMYDQILELKDIVIDSNDENSKENINPDETSNYDNTDFKNNDE